jgi:serine/threonine protein kinase
METERICPSCGRPLAASAPQGLCAECLLKAGFGTGVAPVPGEPTSQPPFTPPPLAEMVKLFPQLEVVELLGQGGMGAVYKARQPAIDRWVALKVLPPQSTARPGFSERFNREARALARLNHANIVALHEFGQVGGMPYFVMEYVEGVTLRRLVQERRLEPREALKIVPQICEALQFAHDEGVVHRDIKPENILLDKKGRVKIADFGIAKIMGGMPLTQSTTSLDEKRGSDGAGEGTLTQDQVLGTPNYMAPEQVEHPQAVDHRADIYSLGVVFYEMLTGELPLGRFAPPSKKVQVDVRLDEVVLHALEREPERRYQQASQVKTALETIAQSGPPSAVPSPYVVGSERNRPLEEQSRLEAARQQVQGPASWLVATGILNWIAIPFIVMVISSTASQSSFGGTPAFLALLAALFLSSAMIVAGLKMKRLEAYSLAITGSILATFITPGNLIGLPIGIWSLVVLCRPEVREAFGAGRSRSMTSSGAIEAAGKAFRRVGLRLLLILVVHLALLEALDQASVHWKESTCELWGMALMAGSCVALVWAFWPGFRLPRWRMLGAGAAIVSCFVLWGIDYFYNWHLRPNLGLYQEEDWVAQHPGFQRQLRQRIQNNLWRTTAAASPTASSNRPEGVHRKFVRLVVDKDAMTFEGQPTTWEGVGALLEQVTDRTNTVLECAVTSDQITVQQQNEWSSKCAALAHTLGFEYSSFIGVHPLGSKGTPRSD